MVKRKKKGYQWEYWNNDLSKHSHKVRFVAWVKAKDKHRIYKKKKERIWYIECLLCKGLCDEDHRCKESLVKPPMSKEGFCEKFDSIQ